MSIITPIIDEVVPIIDISDAVARAVTRVLDKVQEVAHGNLSEVIPAIQEARQDVPALVHAVTQGTSVNPVAPDEHGHQDSVAGG